MYIYDHLHNIVHNADNLKLECNLSPTDKENCYLIDNLDNIDQQGLLSEHTSFPTRCPHCMQTKE